MPVLTWKRILALAFLCAGTAAVIAGAVAADAMLLAAGGLALAGAIGFVAVGTYRRAGFAIHFAAQRHEQLLALIDTVQRLEARVTAVDAAMRQTLGRDLQSLVLNAFRDVDGRVEDLVAQVADSVTTAADQRREMDALMSSVNSALRAVGDRLDTHGSGIERISRHQSGLRETLESASADLRARLEEHIGGQEAAFKALNREQTELHEEIHRTVTLPLRALARELGTGKLRFDVLNDASSMRHVQSCLPLTAAPPPIMSGWSLEPSSLAELLELVSDRKPGLIVECGSGVSTIWLARAAAEYGGRVVALEHLEDYAARTRADLARHGLDGIAEVRFAELETHALSGQEYRWYSRQGWSDLPNIDLLLVDGPPKATGPRARYPAIPLLKGSLSHGALIVLDDVHREEERDVLADWRVETSSLGAERQLGPRTVAMDWLLAAVND